MSPERPRVAYVVKVYPRLSETFIVNELLAHERAGVELEVFSLRPPGDGRFHEMIGQVRAPVTYVPSSGLHGDVLWTEMQAAARELPGAWDAVAEAAGAEARDVYQALWLAREARRRGIGHLHAHFANAAGVVARTAASAAAISYSLTAHAKDIFHDDVDQRALRLMLCDARAAVTVSDFNLAHLRALAPEAPLHRVYNGLDLAALPWRDPARRGPRIVAVGRLVEKKGFGDLVDACALLAREGREVDCQIIGAGPLRDALAARIAEHGLEGRVRLAGARTQAEVHDAVREAAVLAAPCVVGGDGNRDGLPTVLLEAMALGTPVVTTPVTGIPELVRDAETGVLVGERQPGALARALAALLDDPGLRVRLARAGRARVEADFDADRNAAALRACAWDAEPASVLAPAGR